MKTLHRLIMTSAAYRQTARREPSKKESTLDPANRLLWRFPPRRLDAEEIRDAMLQASGELQHVEGGPSKPGASPVRSIYVKKIRNTPDPFLSSFDAPAGFASEPDRIATTTPTQSLLVSNGEWTAARARALATRLLSSGDSPGNLGPASIAAAFEAALGRPPSPDERADARNFLAAALADPGLLGAPADKFPGENGLRPAARAFGKARGVELGDKSLWLQPGSRFERLALEDLPPLGDEFTIEAVAVLDKVHANAHVNTLLSQWNGDQQSPGWTFGVTSEKSRYDPRNFILQLVGEDFQDSSVYEVVASGLRFPVGVPVYFAAALSAHPSSRDTTAGSVTFFMKDLSEPSAKLRSVTQKHSVVQKIDTAAHRLLLGGRDQAGHLWDGQLARLAISRGALSRDQLLTGSESASAERLVDWTFHGEDGENPAPGSAWLRDSAAPPGSGGIAPQKLEAFTDFCHALLVSNEFLYLH
jgi:hypothetical protein